jgi:hypothetical protein
MPSNMGKYILSVIFILIIIFFYNHSKERVGELQSFHVKVEDSQNLAKYDDHCYKFATSKDIEIINRTVQIFRPLPINDIEQLNNTIESSYLFSFYAHFLSVYRKLFRRYQLSILSNPKYYLIDAIGLLDKGKFNESTAQLLNFINVSELYSQKPNEFYRQGCSERDLDWLYNHESHYTYDLADTLNKFIDRYFIKKNNLDFKVYNNFIKDLKFICKDNKILGSNLEWIFFKLLNTQFPNLIQSMKNAFPLHNLIIHESHIDIFNDNYNYIFTSQIELITLHKFNEVLDYILKNDISPNDLPNNIGQYEFVHLLELFNKYKFILSNKKEEHFSRIFNDYFKYVDETYSEIKIWQAVETPRKTWDSMILEINNNSNILLDSTLYYKAHNYLINQDFFFYLEGDVTYSTEAWVQPDTTYYPILYSFSRNYMKLNIGDKCEDAGFCDKIYYKLLEYFLDIYYYNGEKYKKFKNEILISGNEPVNPINNGSKLLIYSIDDYLGLNPK